jgi:hypothetical protein
MYGERWLQNLRLVFCGQCAGKLFREVLNIVPDQRICLRGLGSMALAVCKFDEALRWLQRGVVVYPNDALFHARYYFAWNSVGIL